MRISFYARKISHWASDLPVGGVWGRTVHEYIQKNLRWLWFDGLYASASDNIIINFISLYILSLGASEFQIGLMSSISSFLAALMLFFGAVLAERVGHHKEIVVLSGGLIGRLCILMLVFVPILFHGASVVWIAIAFSVLRDGFNNLAYPAWMSVINETIPIEGRGRYFGSRNFVMGIAGMITTLAAGKIITMFVHQTGYQIVLAAAFVLGLASSYSFFKLKTEPTIKRIGRKASLSIKAIPGLLRGHPQFVALMLTAGLWNFAINISGPFFSVYMVQDLHFSASIVGLTNVATVLSGLLVLNGVGGLSDRLGPRKLQIYSMILIPLLPVMWIFAREPWHIILINIFGGTIWAAFNLTSFNLMLNSIPKTKVPSYSALYQIMVTLSLALGAIIGSVLITRFGFYVLLIASAVVRVIATILFARLVQEPVKEVIEVVST
jgi:MFS family permease